MTFGLSVGYFWDISALRIVIIKNGGFCESRKQGEQVQNSMRKRNELTVTERAAFIGWRLMSGDVWTTQEVATLLGMEWTAAYKLLDRVSRILPIYQDDEKRWTRIPERDSAT